MNKLTAPSKTPYHKPTHIDKTKLKPTKLFKSPTIPRTPHKKPSEDKMSVYRQKFKLFDFYLYDLDAKERQQAKSKINLLGAKVSDFINAKISHFVSQSKVETSHPTLASLLQKNPSIKIWTLTKLNQVLSVLSPNPPDNLVDALYNEKVYGLSTHDKSRVLVPFSSYYFLVEELSGQYKSIACKEFESNTWPVILDKHSSSSVFAAPRQSSSEHEEQSATELESDETGRSFNCIPVSASNNGSVASQPKILKDKKFLQLEQRVVGPPPPKKSQVVGMGFYTRSGYCENCNIRYEEYHKHVHSAQHRQWANQEKNFATLDKLIQKIQKKRLAEQVLDSFDELVVDYQDFEESFVNHSPMKFLLTGKKRNRSLSGYLE